MASSPIAIVVLGLLIRICECDYDLDYYPEPNYELEFLSSVEHGDHAEPSPHIDVDHVPIPDHDHELDHEPEPSAEHEHELPPHLDDPHPEQVRNRWERRLGGGGVEGGYTVLEPDGTVHHVRYTESKKPTDRRIDHGTQGNSTPGNHRG